MFKRKTISYFAVVIIHFKERIYEIGTSFMISRNHFGKVNEKFAFMILFWTFKELQTA